MSDDMSSTGRARIIHAKRPLLPPQSSQSCVNPSSKPADVQIRKPPFSSLPTSSEKDAFSDAQEVQQERGRPVNIECDFSKAPQPFLDPDIWSKMRKQAQELGQGREEGSSGDSEENERRREREAEYGGLAIHGRAARRRKV